MKSRMTLRTLLLAACLAPACESSPNTPSRGQEDVADDDEVAVGSSNQGQTRGPDDQRPPPAPDAGISSPPKVIPSIDIYDPATIPAFELFLDADAIAVLSNKQSAAAKTWAHARFRCGEIEFADVGVRLKGSSTLRALPEKASLKIKLNKFVKKQKLYGLEELTLNNMVSDATFLAERLAYHVFRSAELPAPKANTAHLAINGENYGIYANVETPNEQLIERLFRGRARSLYEVNWGGWLPTDDYEKGFEIDIQHPDAAEGTMPDVEQLVAAVAAAKPETLLADLEPRLHTEQWLRHSATEALTGHIDGYAFGKWGSHNYFLVGDADGRFSLIPWSTDLTFSDRLQLTDASTPLNEIALATCKTSTCWDAYKAQVVSVLEVYESLDLVTLAHQWHDQIAVLAANDPKREESLETHTAETARLYEWLAARPGVVRSQLGL